MHHCILLHFVLNLTFIHRPLEEALDNGYLALEWMSWADAVAREYITEEAEQALEAAELVAAAAHGSSVASVGTSIIASAGINNIAAAAAGNSSSSTTPAHVTTSAQSAQQSSSTSGTATGAPAPAPSHANNGDVDRRKGVYVAHWFGNHSVQICDFARYPWKTNEELPTEMQAKLRA